MQYINFPLGHFLIFFYYLCSTSRNCVMQEFVSEKMTYETFEQFFIGTNKDCVGSRTLTCATGMRRAMQ